jgi:hypothetical protein
MPGLEKRDLAEFGAARLQDQFFDAVLALWRRRQAEGWSQRKVADSIGRDPAWVSRNLRAPGNWTLLTAGALIQGLDGEADISIAALEDRPTIQQNYDAYEEYKRISPPLQYNITNSGNATQIQIGANKAFQIAIGSAR